MKKRMIILLQVLIATVLIGTSVYAAIDTTLNITTSKNNIERGEDFSVTMSLKDVDTTNKVLGVEGYINYNKDIFEEITIDSIVKDTNNKITIAGQSLEIKDVSSYGDLSKDEIVNAPSLDSCITFNKNLSNGNDIKILIDFPSAVSTDTDLITIKFKVKENATLGEIKNAIEYKLFDITTDGSETVTGISKTVDVTIKEKVIAANNTVDNNTIKDNTNNTVNNTVENKVNNTVQNKTNNTVKNTNNSIKSNTTVDNTIASTIIPAAGGKAVVIPAIILILCAYVFYNRYMKYKEF